MYHPVVALALQYRWLGQVSEHERERLRRALTNAMNSVARDLDVELSRAVNRLDMARLGAGETLGADENVSPGAAPSSDPSNLIDEVFYVERADSGEDRLQVKRCERASPPICRRSCRQLGAIPRGCARACRIC